MDQFQSSSEPYNGLRSTNPYQRKELFLDTKGSCFLCLNANEDYGDFTERLEEVCLRNICRYLNISACSILLKSLKGQVGLTEQEMTENETLLLTGRYDFSVMMCPSCSSLAHKFSEMTTELEHLKMLLREKVSQFHGILSQSNHQDAGRLKPFIDKLRDNCENPVEYRLVENLRQEGIIRSISKIRNCQPKVILRRHISIPATGHINCSQDLDRDSNAVVEIIPPKILTNKTSNKTPKGTESLATNNNTEIVVEENEDAMVTESANDFEDVSPDPLGLSPSPPPPRPANSFPETVHTKVSSLSAKIFVSKIFVNNFRNVQWDSNDKLHSRCRSVCRICFLECRPQSIRQHLVNNHVQIFFQHKMPKHMAQDTFVECCKKFFSTEINSAALQMSCRAGLGSRTRALLCPYCNIKCGNESIRRYHLMNEHFHILEAKCVSFLQDDIQDISAVENGGTTGVTVAAREHQSGTTIGTDSPTVLNSVPEENITIRSMPLPPGSNNYSSADVRKCVADMFESYFERLDKKSTDTSLYRCRLVCKYCNVSLNGSSARQHLVNQHVHVLFKHKMSHNLSEELFIECCRNLVLSESDQKPRGGLTHAASKCHTSVLCTYCSVQQRDKNMLIYHLVSEHYHILEQKLMILQQSISPGNLLYFPEDGNYSSGDLRPIVTDYCKPVMCDSGHGEQFDRTDAMEEDEPMSSFVAHDIVMDGSIDCHDDQQSAVETLIETDTVSSVKGITEEPTETIQLSSRFPNEMHLPVNSHIVQPCWNNFYDILQCNGKSIYKCLLCSNTNNWGNIRQHLANQHPEKLFAASRSVHLSEEEFKTQCTELLKLVTSQAGREKAELETRNLQPLFCSFCNENCYDNFRLRYHVVEDHYAILVQKLEELQKESADMVGK